MKYHPRQEQFWRWLADWLWVGIVCLLAAFLMLACWRAFTASAHGATVVYVQQIPMFGGAVAVSASGYGGVVTNYTENGTNFQAHIFTNFSPAVTNYFIVSNGTLSCDVLVVAGGGATYTMDLTGGGGAGGVIYTNGSISGTNTIIVGKGGNLTTYASNSAAFGFTAVGGGFAFSPISSYAQGGSGAGGSYLDNTTNGYGIVGQGNDGGHGVNAQYNAGGGGGASQTGMPATASNGGKGGDGRTFTITGVSTVYGGGGGGGAYTGSSGEGGSGGGGRGGDESRANVAGTDGTGGGAGGSKNIGTGKVGGSGIVIVRYPQ